MTNVVEKVKVPGLAADLQSLMKAIRVIAQAIDTRSKAMSRVSGLTIPQVVILQGVRDLGEVTTNGLSRHVDLSPGTVVSILDKLEERGFIERYRNAHDRRVVHTRMTASGAAILAQAPSLLPDEVVLAIKELDDVDRRSLVGSFQSVAAMLNKAGEPPIHEQGDA
ncbi:MAG TPA: MarR family winged helix-turn-helix transcriptional regulator [Saliniramus sp.]|nr:MarR family winged helix-turn-helix transcriptional regulator [Saliniramus sp.]